MGISALDYQRINWLYWHAGHTWAQIAERFGISERLVRVIVYR